VHVHAVRFRVFCLFACDDPPPDKASPLGSRVELAAGDVWLTVEGNKERLITGAMLPEQAAIEVGAGARALIRLGSGTGAFFRGGSKALVEGGSISLDAGEMWTDVPADERELGTFKAGDVTVTASGAGLDIAKGVDGVQVYVARGLAVVAAPGGRAEVQSGEQAQVKGKGKPEVGPVAFWEDWTGGMADRELLAGIGGRAAGKLYGIDRDRSGSPPKELQITYQAVRIYIRDGIAQTTVDQRFFNPTSTDVEGWYWFTVPEGASVERFAWEVDGVLVDGEMIERKQAAASYEAAVQARTFSPALLEWVDGRTFRAKIFPVPATGERRVVLSYTELLPVSDGVYRYVYPMGGEGEVRIQEFSLEVDLGDAGEDLEIATLQDAKVEQDKTKVSMRRSGFVPRSDFLLEIRPTEETEPLRVMRYKSGKDEADYVMLRYSPEVEWGALKEVPGDVVVVLDTSAGGDESERQIRSDAVEAILRALSAGDHFAVVAADLTPRVVYPQEGLAKAEEKEVSAAMESLSEVSTAGATDLGEMFAAALSLVHESEQPAVVYVGDGRPTVGEVTATALAERLRRSLGDSRARLFTIAVGAEANHSMLERLARVGGGKAFRIDQPEQTVQEALRFAGLVKTPTLTDLTIDAGGGLDQLFSTAAGKVSEGEEVVLLARTHHALPDTVKITGRLGGKDVEREYDISTDEGEEYGYIPSLWARLYLQRLMGEGLEDNRGTIISLGLNYSLMTPFTSFLVLESPTAYDSQGIPRRERFRFGSLDDDNKNTGVALAMGPALPLLGLTGCADEGYDLESAPQMDEVPEWLKKDTRDEEQGGKGKRHKGEEGQMGQRDARKTDNHYGTKGPKDNPDPHMARSQAKEAARNAGILASLSEQNGQLGQDPEAALGGLLGEQTGEQFGYGGLGLQGTGRGGGGTGEGSIGLGDLNTIGHGGGGGSGSGYGRGAGGLGGRRGKSVRIRSGAAMVKGSLSKEVIRRIVHRHINEVKFCYERELARRPDIEGVVSVKFIISSTGAVQMAAVANSSLGNAQVENCMAQAVRRWTFPQPEGGGIVIVTYPFKLYADGGSTTAKKLKPEPPPDPAPEPVPIVEAAAPALSLTPTKKKKLFKLRSCSDASRRPLYHRRILWQRRLAYVTSPAQVLRIFTEAGERCELPSWRARKTLLDLIERRVRSPESVAGLISAFSRYPTAQRYLRRRIMRHALDPDLTMGLWYGHTVNWGAVKRGLVAIKDPDKRLTELRKILEKHPDDPAGRNILVAVLFENEKYDEARAEASRLKRDGLATPVTLAILCDLQADAGHENEARRSCSELVEFNSEDPLARQRLGDLFLRHGWYGAAYRQYRTLVEVLGSTKPSAMLRLAAAAAGMGKIDEALRIERKVAAGEGEPGPDDPRRWARLHSAVRLSKMILQAQAGSEQDKVKALTRSLKRTQVAGTPTTMVVLVWEDLESVLELLAEVDDKPFAVADRVVSPWTGLMMLDVGELPPAELELSVKLRSAKLKRAVGFSLITITWDGKNFTLDEKRGELPADTDEFAFAEPPAEVADDAA